MTRVTKLAEGRLMELA